MRAYIVLPYQESSRYCGCDHNSRAGASELAHEARTSEGGERDLPCPIVFTQNII